MDDIKFSVLMSIYINEKASYFNQAMKSIWDNQTLKPNEIVLVQDGPLTTGLNNVIRVWKEKLNETLKVVSLQENVGLGKALNKGLEHCSYDIVARMDTDDIAKPERFEKQIVYLQNNPQISVLGSGVLEFKNKKGDLSRERILPSKELKKYAKLRNPLNHPTVVFRKTAIQEVGSYKPMKLFEDYYLWVRLLNDGHFIKNLKEPLLYFRIGNDMIGRRSGWDYASYEFKFYKKLLDIGFINSYQFFVSIILRVPLRVMPKSMLRVFYRKFLRNE